LLRRARRPARPKEDGRLLRREDASFPRGGAFDERREPVVVANRDGSAEFIDRLERAKGVPATEDRVGVPREAVRQHRALDVFRLLEPCEKPTFYFRSGLVKVRQGPQPP